MRQIKIGIENREDDIPKWVCTDDNDTGTENFLLITIDTLNGIVGEVPQKIVQPLQDLLKQGQPPKEIRIDLYAQRREPQNDLFFYCFLAVISCLPLIPVEYLIVNLNWGDEVLDDLPLLQALKEAILHPNTSLKYLELYSLALLEYQSLQTIGDMLVHENCRLQGLSFNYSQIPHLDKWIANYLGRTRLRLLDLAQVFGFKENATAFALGDVLKNHPTLKFLDVGLDTCDTRGLKNIATALKSNQVLEYLNLTLSPFVYDALIEFAEALKENRTLTVFLLYIGQLYQYQNGFTEEQHQAWLEKCGAAFGSTFEINDTLLYCLVPELGGLEGKALETLEEKISQNRSLEVCDIGEASSFGQRAVSVHLNRIERKKVNFLWNIWEEIGDRGPNYNQRQSVFAGCDFRVGSIINANGSEFDISGNSLMVDLAKAVGLFENTAPSSDASNLFTSHFQWLPKEVADAGMKLPLSKAEIESEQQRSLKRQMPSDFWSQPPAKRRKIEEKGEEKKKGFGSK